VAYYNSKFIVKFAIFCSIITGVSNADEVWNNCTDMRSKAYYESYPDGSQSTFTSWMIPYKLGRSVDTGKTLKRFADSDGQGLGTPWTKCYGTTGGNYANGYRLSCEHLATGTRFVYMEDNHAHLDYPDRKGNMFSLYRSRNSNNTTRIMCKRRMKIDWHISEAVHSTDGTGAGERSLPYIYVQKIEHPINRVEGFPQGPSF